MKTMSEVIATLKEFELGWQFLRIKPHLRNAITMEPEFSAEEALPVGTSRLGGLPDLPEGVEWFRHGETGAPLSFICQINFAEVKHLDKEKKLPSSGMLYFFYDCADMPWGFDPKDGAGKAVYYYDGDLSALRKAPAPEDEGFRFQAAPLRFEAELDLPNVYSKAYEAVKLPERKQEAYEELSETVLFEMPLSKLLGHSTNMQDEMELQCELVTHGFYCGNQTGYEEGAARGVGAGAKRWRMLLQLSGYEELDMTWGDDGLLYLWITEEDLAARNFAASWLILQCG